MALKIQPITLDDIPVVEQLAYDYNYELDPQEAKKRGHTSLDCLRLQ
jgi:hypothetical protein